MKNFIIYVICLITLVSCNKRDEWLDVKKNKSDIIMSTVSDYEKLMLNDIILNAEYASSGIVSSDDYFVDYTTWLAALPLTRNLHTWEKVFDSSSEGSTDWVNGYRRISYCNVALDGLQKIEREESNVLQYDNVKGTALFFRAYAFYDLLQVYAKPYNKVTASSELGVALKLSADINDVVQRSNIQQCYDQVVADLQLSETLLPIIQNRKTQPTKNSARGLLARVFLNMADYSSAMKYANQALTSNGDLLDYNTLTVTATNPFPTFTAGNKEIVFYARAVSTQLNTPSGNVAYVDTLLFNSYHPNDLRRSLFFARASNGYYTRRPASYANSTGNFAGIANNELYLIRAEANARMGDFNSGINDLNLLLRNRWAKNTFVNFTASNSTEALDLILAERRKEFVFARQRWEDLRRLNLDSRYARIITRKLNGQLFSLPPNDNRYAIPIPQIEVTRSGLEQNPR